MDEVKIRLVSRWMIEGHTYTLALGLNMHYINRRTVEMLHVGNIYFYGGAFTLLVQSIFSPQKCAGNISWV